MIPETIKHIHDHPMNLQELKTLRFLASLTSHDLANRLCAIQGAALMIQEQVNPGNPLYDYCNEIYHEIDTCAELINAFSSFTMTGSGKKDG